MHLMVIIIYLENNCIEKIYKIIKGYSFKIFFEEPRHNVNGCFLHDVNSSINYGTNKSSLKVFYFWWAQNKNTTWMSIYLKSNIEGHIYKSKRPCVFL